MAARCLRSRPPNATTRALGLGRCRARRAADGLCGGCARRPGRRWSPAAPAASAAPPPGCSPGSARMSSSAAATRTRSTRSLRRSVRSGLHGERPCRSTSAIRIASPRCSTSVRAEPGRLDLLVNSAGGQFPQAGDRFLGEGLERRHQHQPQRHLVHDAGGGAPLARRRARRARIVNIVVVTTRGLYGVAHTVAARAGVIGLSRSVAVEWAPLGIRVNCIAPGADPRPKAGRSTRPRRARPIRGPTR